VDPQNFEFRVKHLTKMLNDNFYSGLTAFMRFEAETLHLVASLKDKEKYDVQIAVKNNKMLSELE
jgi:hypothetical protein